MNISPTGGPDRATADPLLLTPTPITGDTVREGALRAVLAEREAELLQIKGHCSNGRCRLHYAHRGPCEEIA
jgi:hypothetical protein